MVEISNSWVYVYYLKKKKNYPFFSVKHPNFWILNFRKGYYKTAYVSRSVNTSEGQLSVFLKNYSSNFLEILHEAREPLGSKTDRANLFFERKILVLGKMPKISP